jgi:hypothetical protein
MKLGRGQRFGPWILMGEKPLGTGGNGVVWGSQDETGRQAAIKFLQSQHFGTQKEKRFRDEIEFLQHHSNEPGVLPLLDFSLSDVFTRNNRPWFATPLAEPFSQSFLSGPANLPKLVRLLLAVSQTMSRLHAKFIYHRDLKPENLFQLGESALIGDFGLADFPDKDAITMGGEIVGPLFYVAPEMMGMKENTSAGPADVYSLAKTLWVLASGNRYPLQGEQRMDTPALRLSTYCGHEHANVIDSLLERATAFQSSQRPTMKEFSTELAEWLRLGTVSSRVALDLLTVAKEGQGVFEPAIAAEQKREQLIRGADAVLLAFDEVLRQINDEIHAATRIVPTMNSANLYERFHRVAYIGGPRLVWREARQVRLSTKIDRIEVFFQAFAQVEAVDSNEIRLLVGYLSQPVISGSPVLNQKIWTKESVAPLGSATLANAVEMLKAEFVTNLPQSLSEYVKLTKQYLIDR